jgi:hypothetical protein
MDTAHGVAHFNILVNPVLDFSGRNLHVLNMRVTLDPLSVYCLGCHDNPNDLELTSPGSLIYKHATDNGLSHPIGINYDEAASRTKDVKSNGMDQRIMLFDGKIGCCSCHDPYALGGGVGLRIGDRVNWVELCKGCHVR